MTALSAGADRKRRGSPNHYSYLIAASTTIYQNALVAVNAGGYLVPAANTSGLVVVGIATKTYDNSAGSNGDLTALVEADAQYLFTASSIAQSAVPELMHAIDDNTIDETGSNSVKAGKLVEFVSSTQGWVYIPGAGQTTSLS